MLRINTKVSKYYKEYYYLYGYQFFDVGPFVENPACARQRRAKKPTTSNKQRTLTMTAAGMNSSQAYLDEEKAWDDVAALMKELVSNTEAYDDHLQAEIDQGNALNDSLSNEKQSLHSRAQQISSTINAQIEEETAAFESESNELATQIRTVQSLEQTLEQESKRFAHLTAEQTNIQQSIDTYKSEASDEVNAIDEIEISHMKQLKRNRRAISMYAQMTNIKWDYSQTDVLAGEVSLPKTFEHRRFCVEKDLGEVEIAERIWGIIEG